MASFAIFISSVIRLRPAFRQMITAIYQSRTLAVGCIIGLLAACASPRGPSAPLLQEAASYRSHAKSYYAPPGPTYDPWGPYIVEASIRFDVPQTWIRAVIKQESGGHLYDKNGHFITSLPGAMGLMQLMPPTYDEMRIAYHLGPDPYDPHDNIVAGTAYIRQMYDLYGSPGFLAAYNDGPGSLNLYLHKNRPLPRETRRYVASIGPKIIGVSPNNRSAVDLLVARHAQAARKHSRFDSHASNVRLARRSNHKRRIAPTPMSDWQVAQLPSTPRRGASARKKIGTVHRSVHAKASQASWGGSRRRLNRQNWVGETAAQPIPIGHRLKAQPVSIQSMTSRQRARLAQRTRAHGRASRNTAQSAPQNRAARSAVAGGVRGKKEKAPHRTRTVLVHHPVKPTPRHR